MEKFYITSDKVGDFIQRMYEKGIKVEADPKNNQLCVTKSKGGYEWVKVFHKDTYENLCKAFDKQEA